MKGYCEKTNMPVDIYLTHFSGKGITDEIGIRFCKQAENCKYSNDCRGSEYENGLNDWLKVIEE